MKSSRFSLDQNPNHVEAERKSSWTIDIEEYHRTRNLEEIQPAWYSPLELDETFEFSDKTIRFGFLRKVFAIFVAQLLFTTGLVSLALFVPSINESLLETNSTTVIVVVIVLFGLSVGPVLTLNISKRLAKSFPWNYLTLGILTILIGVPVAWISVYIETNHVLYTGGITLLSCILISVFTFQTKLDFTWFISVLLVIISVGLSTLIFFLCLPSEETEILLVGSGVALFISIYLVVFVQLLMKFPDGCCCCCSCCRVSPEDYIAAASRIYLVVVVIFLVALAALALMGAGKGGGGNCSGGGGDHAGGSCAGACGGASGERDDPEDAINDVVAY